MNGFGELLRNFVKGWSVTAGGNNIQYNMQNEEKQQCTSTEQVWFLFTSVNTRQQRRKEHETMVMNER